jgi:Tfp pilus assembly protein PilV
VIIQRKHRPFVSKGFSLMETLIAVFLLLATLTFVLELYCRSFQHLNKTERTFQGTAFARNTMEQIRAWAKDPANFEKAVWTPFTTVSDSRYPDFTLRAKTEPTTLTAACTAFEDSLGAPERLEMPTSARLVTLEVSHQGSKLWEISSLVAEPERPLHATKFLEVVPTGGVPGVLAVDEELEFQASLIDKDGAPIKDVEFVWSVQPGSGTPSSTAPLGNGTIVKVSRDGTRAVFKNRFERTDGRVLHTGGVCRVVADARYFAAFRRGTSVDLSLAK